MKTTKRTLKFFSVADWENEGLQCLKKVLQASLVAVCAWKGGGVEATICSV